MINKYKILNKKISLTHEIKESENILDDNEQICFRLYKNYKKYEMIYIMNGSKLMKI